MGIRITVASTRGGSSTVKAFPIRNSSHTVFNTKEVRTVVIPTTKLIDFQDHGFLIHFPIKPGKKPDIAAVKVKPGKYAP